MRRGGLLGRSHNGRYGRTSRARNLGGGGADFHDYPRVYILVE